MFGIISFEDILASWALEITLSQTFYLSHFLSHSSLGLHPWLVFSFDEELPFWRTALSAPCSMVLRPGPHDLRFLMTSGPRLSTAGGWRLAWIAVAPSKPQRRVTIHGLVIFLVSLRSGWQVRPVISTRVLLAGQRDPWEAHKAW